LSADTNRAAVEIALNEAVQSLQQPEPQERDDAFVVLVVDDDMDCRELLMRRLGARGYIPVTADSVKAARLQIDKRIPDAILLDLTMPGTDGITYLQELRADERTRSVPILLISARHESSTQVTGLEVGADDYVTKPFNYPVLFARLKTHLRVRSLMRQLEDQKRMLQQIATRDDLTNVLNRRALLLSLEIEMSRTLRYGRPLSVLMVDIDGFKQVNDSLGHAAGDEMLKEVTQRILSTLRDPDLLGRLGGDEFGVILPETDLEHALLVAERLRVAVSAEPIKYQENSRTPSTSVGASTLPLGFDMTAGRLFARADAALYESKRLGKNRVCYYDPAMGRVRALRDESHAELTPID
jgi:diguanylate cyclase (GGDEF)-like protein